MDRKQFLASMGAAGLGGGVCALLGARAASGEEPAAAGSHPCSERMEFAEKWVGRFMDVLDDRFDGPTRAAVMEANGRACFRAWAASSGNAVEPVDFDTWAAKVRERAPGGPVRVEGRTVHFEFSRDVNGNPVTRPVCLCPLVENRPAGLSATYCHCSVGYVAEMFGRRFGRPVKVELVESVLRGGERCRFRVEVA